MSSNFELVYLEGGVDVGGFLKIAKNYDPVHPLFILMLLVIKVF